MNSLKVIIIVFATLASARPQYGSGGNPNCVTEFREVQNITTREEFRKVCKPVTSRSCVTSTRSRCVPTKVQECRTENQQKCWTSTRDKCLDEFINVQQPYTDNECKVVNIKVCEKGWVNQNYNEKVWADLPETCKWLPQSKCEQVQRLRTVKERKPKCTKEPFKECKTIPQKKCIWVTKQKCRNEPFQDCKDVTNQVCENKHFQVPVPITQRVAVQVCKDQIVTPVTSPPPTPVRSTPPSNLYGNNNTVGPRSGISIRSGIP